MKTLRIVMAGLIAVSLSMVALVASDKDKDRDNDRDRDNRISARLIGYNEVPSVSTPARGRFRATISRDQQSIDYTLSFEGIESVVNQSHIHFAQKAVNGTIVVWLCQGATRAPAAQALITPECPTSPGGTVSGTITADSVVTQTAAAGLAQQINAGELDEVIAAIRAGTAYANVHSGVSPGGEIRGQLRTGDNDNDDDHHGRDRW